jgi:hypothetical protein
VLTEIWPRLGELLIHAATLKFLRRAAFSTANNQQAASRPS